MDEWDLETKKNDCSMSIINPGFCRLALFTAPSGLGGMFFMAHAYYTVVNKSPLFFFYHQL